MQKKYQEKLESELKELRENHQKNYKIERELLLSELANGTNSQFNTESNKIQTSLENRIQDEESAFVDVVSQSEEYKEKSKAIDERISKEVTGDLEQNADYLSFKKEFALLKDSVSNLETELELDIRESSRLGTEMQEDVLRYKEDLHELGEFSTKYETTVKEHKEIEAILSAENEGGLKSADEIKELTAKSELLAKEINENKRRYETKTTEKIDIEYKIKETLNKGKNYESKYKEIIEEKQATLSKELKKTKELEAKINKFEINYNNSFSEVSKDKAVVEKKELLDSLVKQKSKSVTDNLYRELDELKDGKTKIALENTVIQNFDEKQDNHLKKLIDLKTEQITLSDRADRLKTNRIESKKMSKVDKVEKNVSRINQHLKHRTLLKKDLEMQNEDVKKFKKELESTSFFDRQGRKFAKLNIKTAVEKANNTRKSIQNVEKTIIDIQENKERLARIKNYVQEKTCRFKASLMKAQESRIAFTQMTKNTINKVKEMNKSTSRKQESEKSKELSR